LGVCFAQGFNPGKFEASSATQMPRIGLYQLTCHILISFMRHSFFFDLDLILQQVKPSIVTVTSVTPTLPFLQYPVGSPIRNQTSYLGLEEVYRTGGDCGLESPEDMPK
jgi:hypothetical protein